jgi:predicted dehydrogenase
MAVRKGTERVRWGIIGPGNIARHAVAPAIRWSSNGSLQSVASRSAARAAALALETGAESSCGGYDKLLERDDVDAVYIGLPNGLHEEWVLKAAAAGKHVLCEKAITFTAESATRMAEACNQAGVLLMEAYMYRHHPQWYHVRDRLYGGQIGDLRLIQAHLTGTLENAADHRWSTELGRGALYDVTCYGVNMARYVSGREPVAVSAKARLRAPGVDESSAAVLEFDGGLVAVVSGSLAAHNSQGLRIIGTEGEIVVERPVIPGMESTPVRIHTKSGSEELTVGGANHFLHMVEHFASCVLSGSGLRYPGEDGVANTRVLEAIAKAL